MPNDTESIEHKLEQIEKRALTAGERDRVWAQVEPRLSPGLIPSPFQYGAVIVSQFFTHRATVPVVVALVVLLGAGGTVLASNDARPGDILFPVDRALEDVRLALASSPEAQADLKLRFAEERVHEFEQIVGEEVVSDDAEDISRDEGGALTEAEANIFTNETVVRVEMGGRHHTFTTDADTRQGIIDEIAGRFSLSTTTVDAVLSLELEGRESVTDDKVTRGDVSGKGRERIERALNVMEGFLTDARNSSKDNQERIRTFDDRLFSVSNRLPADLRTRIRHDEGRIEFRDEDGSRVRVEVKDGEVRVKTEGGGSHGKEKEVRVIQAPDVWPRPAVSVATEEDEAVDEDESHAEVHGGGSVTSHSGSDSRDEEDEDEDDDMFEDFDNARDVHSNLEVKVKVDDGRAEVKVKIDGDEDEFVLSLSDRAAIVDTIASRYGLSVGAIEDVLEFEID